MQISSIFEETPSQEKEHAKRLFKFLEGGEVEVSAAFPADVIGSTLENLKASAARLTRCHCEERSDEAIPSRDRLSKIIEKTFLTDTGKRLAREALLGEKQ